MRWCVYDHGMMMMVTNIIALIVLSAMVESAPYHGDYIDDLLVEPDQHDSYMDNQFAGPINYDNYMAGLFGKPINNDNSFAENDNLDDYRGNFYPTKADNLLVAEINDDDYRKHLRPTNHDNPLMRPVNHDNFMDDLFARATKQDSHRDILSSPEIYQNIKKDSFSFVPSDADGRSSERFNSEGVPVNGGWDSWSHWGNCHGNMRYRRRYCVHPIPSNGGKVCVKENGDSGEYERQVTCDGCNKEKDNEVYAKYGWCQLVKEKGVCTMTVFKGASQARRVALIKRKCAFTCFQCPAI